MRRPPIHIRTFLVGTILVLLLLPTLAGGAAWFVERDHQQANVAQHLNSAVAYLTIHRKQIQQPAVVHEFAQLLNREGLLAQLVVVSNTPPGKSQVYVSPALAIDQGKPRSSRGARGTPVPTQTSPSGLEDSQRQISIARKTGATMAVDLYFRPASRANRALVALITGVLVLLAGMGVAVWLAGRWMVAPLARLSAQVDKVAGGDLAIAVPRSRIGEIANIGQAVDGMTVALGEGAQRRAEADEARRFLVTSIAHDLRTPLFALRGHLQAIGSRLGNPNVHLERAEARADALERLIGNLFTYTRDDYAQPTPQLETVPVAALLQEVAAGVEHATRLGDNTFELDGDRLLSIVVDRDRFKRAFTNILDNALRYSPAGAPIHLRWAAVDGSSVEIIVQDDGPGIDPDLLPHVFEPGVHGSPAAGTVDGGAGLGLAIAKRLLEHQHATLTARNQPAGGAEVRLTVRRADV
jgi:signal transduction histidine kinase